MIVVLSQECRHPRTPADAIHAGTPAGCVECTFPHQVSRPSSSSGY